MNRELPYVNAFGTVDISSAKNVAEALKLSALNWSVESKHIYDENGEPYDKFRANVRETDGKLLGIVTDKYHIIQNITQPKHNFFIGFYIFIKYSYFL